jgi:hypothetical protein
MPFGRHDICNERRLFLLEPHLRSNYLNYYPSNAADAFIYLNYSTTGCSFGAGKAMCLHLQSIIYRYY